jgi:hypothetical protein
MNKRIFAPSLPTTIREGGDVTPEVEVAVDEIRQAFEGHMVEVEDEAQGGAYVIVREINVGERFKPATSWIGFLIPFQYPDADVYPHFTDRAFTRADGSALGSGLSAGSWRGNPAVQISRRSNGWNPAVDTAAGKLLKVLQWMKSL